jgi:hypothetical protein
MTPPPIARESELEPCPWCNSSCSCARIKNEPWQGGCSNPDCQVRPHIEDDSRSRLIARWNTRPSLALGDVEGVANIIAEHIALEYGACSLSAATHAAHAVLASLPRCPSE